MQAADQSPEEPRRVVPWRRPGQSVVERESGARLLPARVQVVERIRRFPRLFLIMVVIPSLLATVYYGLIASPIYVSEAQFVVRAPTEQQPVGLNALLQGTSLGGGSNNAFSVHEYVSSRDALRDLERRFDVRKIFAPDGVDLLSKRPLPWEGGTFEELFRGYNRFVEVFYDSNTGISTLRVKAFRPKDSAAVATALLDGGESVVNTLNDRAARDSVADFADEVSKAEARIKTVQDGLTKFRNREKLIDPGRQSLAGLELVAKLSIDLASLRAQRTEIATVAPQSPQLPVIDNRIRALEHQVGIERSRVVGGDQSLAPKMGEYERLVLEREFSDKALASAITALENARWDAQRKQLYLERIVKPNVPDFPILPNRGLSILTVVLSLLLSYGCLKLILAGLREQRQG